MAALRLHRPSRSGATIRKQQHYQMFSLLEGLPFHPATLSDPGNRLSTKLQDQTLKGQYRVNIRTGRLYDTGHISSGTQLIDKGDNRSMLR